MLDLSDRVIQVLEHPTALMNRCIYPDETQLVPTVKRELDKYA